jgi:S1-C subfamily serine protease
LTILDSQGRMLAATVQRSSAEADLAVLAVPTATGIPPLALGADVGLGAHVFTIGFPFPSVLGFDPKFAEGAVGGVSGLGSRGLYQVTVPVQPGNSGGPLVDDRGTIVGVIVAKLDAEKVKAATGAAPENVNFAIKASVLAKVLNDAAVTPSTSAGTSGDAVARVSASVCQVIVEPASPAGGPPGMVGRE